MKRHITRVRLVGAALAAATVDTPTVAAIPTVHADQVAYLVTVTYGPDTTLRTPNMP